MAGSPATAGALTRAIEKMIGRFAGNLPSLLTDVSVNCPGLDPEHMWTLLGCFETYAGALLDFSVMRYVQVRREEYHDPDDWDALQEARREYDKVEHQVRLEGANRKEHDGHLRELESSDEEESLYEVLNLVNVRKIRKRPGAPKWIVRLSKALRDYLQQPEKAGEHSLANAMWDVMRKMDRQGSAYLKEEWKKKHKKERRSTAGSARRRNVRATRTRKVGGAGRGILSPPVELPASQVTARTARRSPSPVAEVDVKGPPSQQTPGAKERWKSGSWTGGGSFGPRRARSGSTVPTH